MDDAGGFLSCNAAPLESGSHFSVRGGVCQARLLLPVAFDGHGAGLLRWCEGARVSEDS